MPDASEYRAEGVGSEIPEQASICTTSGAPVDPTFEFGLDTFGDVTVGPDGGRSPTPRSIRNVVEEAVLADQLGVDVIGLGEHHRADFAISLPRPCSPRSPGGPSASISAPR